MGTVFSHNKYNTWYFGIVNQAISQNREKFKGIYYEEHHIIPKSLGGNNSKKNLVLLTGREHFIVHALLTKMCSNRQHEIKMLYAFKAMSTWQNSSHERHFNSILYEKIRKKCAIAHSEKMRGRKMPPLTPEQKERISNDMKSKWLLKSEEEKRFLTDKAAVANRGKKRPTEVIEKYANAQRGKTKCIRMNKDLYREIKLKTITHCLEITDKNYQAKRISEGKLAKQKLYTTKEKNNLIIGKIMKGMQTLYLYHDIIYYDELDSIIRTAKSNNLLPKRSQLSRNTIMKYLNGNVPDRKEIDEFFGEK